jgi:uncharacterized protein
MTVGRVARNAGTEEFFDGAAEGKFLLRVCEPSGHVSRPQVRQCAVCGSSALRWEPASGRASLVSWVVIHGRVVEGQEPPPVTVPVIAQLEEGPWWWSVLLGADPATLTEGHPLRIEFDRPEGSEAVPVFVLASDSGG